MVLDFFRIDMRGKQSDEKYWRFFSKEGYICEIRFALMFPVLDFYKEPFLYKFLIFLSDMILLMLVVLLYILDLFLDLNEI